MNKKIKFTSFLFFIVLLFLLNGCEPEESFQQQDTQDEAALKDEDICRQCEAMTCEKCESTPICRSDKCGNCATSCNT